MLIVNQNNRNHPGWSPKRSHKSQSKKYNILLPKPKRLHFSNRPIYTGGMSRWWVGSVMCQVECWVDLSFFLVFFLSFFGGDIFHFVMFLLSDFWWHLPWFESHTRSPCLLGFLRFTSAMTPAYMLVASMAADPFTHLLFQVCVGVCMCAQCTADRYSDWAVSLLDEGVSLSHYGNWNIIIA